MRWDSHPNITGLNSNNSITEAQSDDIKFNKAYFIF